MFQQLEIKNNVNQNGIGFGLAISKILVEQMQGKIHIQNNKDMPELKNKYS